MSVASLKQRISGGDVTVSELNMHSQSVNQASYPGSAMLHPIIVNSDGSNTTSRVLSWRLHIDQPFTYVHSVQFWFEPFAVPSGWDIRVGIGSSANPADYAAGRPATDFMAKADLDALPARFNLMYGYSTLDYPESSTPNTPIGGTFDSQFVHMWAKVNGDAAAGPILGYGAGSVPNPMVVRFAWVEL